MACAYFRSARANTVIPISAIQCISATINPDNTYSFRFTSDVGGQNTLFLSLDTFPDPVSALEAGYNTLVIELP
jgi:hypothetical protein